ncbi:hypothetical protein [Arenimonas alkanexedens]
MRNVKFLALLLLAALLTACAGGGPPKRIFPPQASLQELRVQPDGRWSASIRIQNFSTVPMRFSRLDASLMIAGGEAARFSLDPGFSVGPGSNELLTHVFQPSDAARAAVDAAIAKRETVRYVLSGRIATSEPETDNPFDYQSRLSPIPGLDGVLR